MQFLNPIWFFALAALSIPIVIHLWNIRPGKTLKVGSISLITEASKSTRRSFKLLDVLLLILRCLLLALLAMLLAAPVWQKYVSAQKAKGWILIPKENFRETYTRFKPLVDSLNSLGYEFHYFNKEFAKQELKIILADSTLKDTSTTANYWGLIPQLENHIRDIPVYLFTQNGINHFKGNKPTVALNSLHWQTYTTADSLSNWIASASLTNSGAIKVTRGSSSPAGIYYSNDIIQGDGNKDIAVNIQAGQPFVSVKGSNQIPVAVDTNTINIAVYTDKYNADANYLKAALLAVVNFTNSKAVIKQYNNPAQIKGEPNWLFWLSEKSITGELKNSKNIFRYAAGKTVDVNSWINETGLVNSKNIALYKQVVNTDNNLSIWQDGYGKPILSLNREGKTKVYNFYTRFDPLWNDLTWSDEFPKLMLKLFDNQQIKQLTQYDKRILLNEQIQPQIIKEGKALSAISTEQTNLSPYLWALLIMVLIAERVLAHQTKTANNG